MTVGSRYTREIKDPEELAAARLAVNKCWLDQPERVIGQPVVVTSDNSLWLQVQLPAGELATALRSRLTSLLPSQVVAPFVPPETGAAPVAGDAPPLNERRAEQIAIPSIGGVAQERAAGMASIYNAAKALIRAELNDEPGVDVARAELNRVYQGFVWQYGVIHDPRNQRLFGDLPELQFLLALERNPRRTPSGRWLADRERIFRERTLRPHQPALPGTLTPTEALLRCLDERGDLNIGYIASLAGESPDAVVETLGERVYRLPGTGQYELADIYLSGNVVAKLRDARSWAERGPAFARNVAALEAIQPNPLGPQEIILNAFWLPGEVVTAFIKSLLPAWTGEAFYSTSLGEWVLTDPGKQGAFAVESTTRWGTKRADAVDILQASLRGVPATVYDVVTVVDREKRVLNPAETVAAQEKQQEIAQAFQRWVWDDPARADELCRLYNERFNSHRMRVYDGSHLSFPGINASLLRGGDLAEYQKGAVWQILQRPSTQLVFCDLATPKGKGRGADEPPTRLTGAELEGEAAETAQEVETAEERWLSNFVYYEIRDGLIAQGVAREEIAFIHDCATKAQRDALFAAVNEGRVCVLIGSTTKMSTGMNVQQRLIALHNLDCPWRPGDLEQRHGRILRQGNHWPEVYVFSYITEGSFDGYMWQGVRR